MEEIDLLLNLIATTTLNDNEHYGTLCLQETSNSPSLFGLPNDCLQETSNSPSLFELANEYLARIKICDDTSNDSLNNCPESSVSNSPSLLELANQFLARVEICDDASSDPLNNGSESSVFLREDFKYDFWPVSTINDSKTKEQETFLKRINIENEYVSESKTFHEFALPISKAPSLLTDAIAPPRKKTKPSLFFKALSCKPKPNIVLQKKVLDIKKKMLENRGKVFEFNESSSKLFKQPKQSIFAKFPSRFSFTCAYE